MRKVFSILLHVIAGIFLCMVIVTAFSNEQENGLKLAVMVVFLLPALIALASGVAIKNKNWKRDIGVVLLSSSGGAAFIAVSLLITRLDGANQLVPTNILDSVSDYVTGIALTICFAGSGWLLLLANPKLIEDAE